MSPTSSARLVLARKRGWSARSARPMRRARRAGPRLRALLLRSVHARSRPPPGVRPTGRVVIHTPDRLTGITTGEVDDARTTGAGRVRDLPLDPHALRASDLDRGARRVPPGARVRATASSPAHRATCSAIRRTLHLADGTEVADDRGDAAVPPVSRAAGPRLRARRARRHDRALGSVGGRRERATTASTATTPTRPRSSRADRCCRPAIAACSAVATRSARQEATECPDPTRRVAAQGSRWRPSAPPRSRTRSHPLAEWAGELLAR